MSRRVLVTGANGYVAQHVLTSFLEAGHSVRGVVRSAAKADQLRKTFAPYVARSQLDFGIVPDIAAPGAFDAVLSPSSSPSPFDTVIHTASPFNYRLNDKPSDFFVPAVNGTTEILRGVARAAPTVRRVVITSSMAAVIDFARPRVSDPVKVYTPADWNPTDWEADALAPGARVNTIYQASKKYAEKAAWQFVEDRQWEKLEGETQHPGFDLVVLNPPMVYGPLRDASQIARTDDLPQSVFYIYRSVMAPGLTAESPVPPTTLHLYVDVRDLAAAHLLAATTPAAGGKRFVLSGEQMSTQRMANLMREVLPEYRGRIPLGDPAAGLMPEGTFEASSKLAEEVLGLVFRSPRETIADLAPQLVEIEEREAAGKA